MSRIASALLVIGLAATAACGGDDPTASTGGGGTGGQGGVVDTGGAGGTGGAGAQGGTGGAGGGVGGEGGELDVPLAGFGTISGECGVLDPAELMTGATPLDVYNAIDFRMTAFDVGLLSDGGQTIMNTPNAGGSSEESEAIAYEVLYRCELAGLLKTETEITYEPPSSTKTDFLVDVDGLQIGVSVVRAFAFMTEYTVQDALDKMTEKLLDIQESSAHVQAPDTWEKQILAVIAEKPENATAVQTALGMIDAATRGDTIVVVTVTDGDDAFVY